MSQLKVILTQVWRDESGNNIMAGSVLTLPEVVGFSLVASGVAELYEEKQMPQRQSRVLEQDRVAAYTGQPRKIRKFS